MEITKWNKCLTKKCWNTHTSFLTLTDHFSTVTVPWWPDQNETKRGKILIKKRLLLWWFVGHKVMISLLKTCCYIFFEKMHILWGSMRTHIWLKSKIIYFGHTKRPPARIWTGVTSLLRGGSSTYYTTVRPYIFGANVKDLWCHLNNVLDSGRT